MYNRGVFDIGSFDLKSVFDENELDYDTETILEEKYQFQVNLGHSLMIALLI